MVRDLLAHTPLLALPIFAMFVFLAVFVSVVVRAFARRDRYADAARLPLEDES